MNIGRLTNFLDPLTRERPVETKDEGNQENSRDERLRRNPHSQIPLRTLIPSLDL